MSHFQITFCEAVDIRGDHAVPITLIRMKRVMPYINIKITDENVTKEQKTRLIEGATQLLVDVLDKNPATTVVVIDEVNTDNWGIGGKCVTELRKQNK
jgi:4-oxalocrotonate tautomerase